MKGPSIRRRIGEDEWIEMNGAIRGDKYWNVAEGRRDHVYAVALSRARRVAPGGMLVRATGVGRALAPEPLARFCRRYRVLLVESRTGTVKSVLTWSAFRVFMANPDVITSALDRGSVPRYINFRIARRMIDSRPRGRSS